MVELEPPIYATWRPRVNVFVQRKRSSGEMCPLRTPPSPNAAADASDGTAARLRKTSLLGFGLGSRRRSRTRPGSRSNPTGVWIYHDACRKLGSVVVRIRGRCGYNMTRLNINRQSDIDRRVTTAVSHHVSCAYEGLSLAKT